MLKSFFLLTFVFSNIVFLQASDKNTASFLDIVNKFRKQPGLKLQALDECLREPGRHIDEALGDGDTLLMQAAKVNDLETVEFCLTRGADVNKRNNDGCTALMYAADSRSSRSIVPVLEALVNAGADVNLQSKSHGKSALHFAVIAPRRDIRLFAARLLGTNLGLRMEIKDPKSTSQIFHGMTPEMFANAFGNFGVANFLKELAKEKELLLQLSYYNTSE